MPLVVRGKHGGSRALLVGCKSYTTTYTRKSTVYDTETLPLHIVCRYSKGRYKRHGVYYFAYIVIGEVRILPQQVAEEYRRRFGIETSYRLMNQVRAHHLAFGGTALFPDDRRVFTAQFVELCQMAASLCPASARTTPSLASFVTSAPLAGLVMGND